MLLHPRVNLRYTRSSSASPAAAVALPVRACQLRRRDESGLREILIARRFRLAVPQRFVFDLARRQFADALEAQHRMAQIGDRLVAVLEVEALEKTLRIVRPHPVDRLPDGIGRPAVPRERISAFFRRHRGDSDDSFGQTAIIAFAAPDPHQEAPRRRHDPALRPRTR